MMVLTICNIGTGATVICVFLQLKWNLKDNTQGHLLLLRRLRGMHIPIYLLLTSNVGGIQCGPE
jgi:hypothetical protein